MSFARLHPAVQHHVAGSLGWRNLRPLQEQAIDPLIDGYDALLLAPTAAGKTEAAMVPLISRMASDGWRGLSAVYVCPLRALINNLEPRIEALLRLVGRRAAAWHGDTTSSSRRDILREPPDVLLTTPESLEVMLVSRQVDHDHLFRDLRAVVIDEVHAFLGDDRGWHLLAVLARIERLAGRRLQRVGLSATVGNPAELLRHLQAVEAPPGFVVAVASEERRAEVRTDLVGSLAGAAKVIAGLHHGEKRLVFCESRSDTEQLAAALHQDGIRVYVSHSSLSRDGRRRAEQAFAEERDCVIVATSTLELGVDIGDLDRVIQLDAPTSVASFLQRLGRTGRRAQTESNMLFLARRPEDLLRALGIGLLWSRGIVEPVTAPPSPRHVLAQQLLALCLQKGRVGKATWPAELPVPGLVDSDNAAEILSHMLLRGMLFEEQGMLMLGPESERTYGSRNFLELLSVFTSPPLVEVRYGRDSLGQVHQSSFMALGEQRPVILLAGRAWAVVEVDWRRRRAQVTPASESGRSRWIGSGVPITFGLAHAMRDVLTGANPPVLRSRRAATALAELRDRFSWVRESRTAVVDEPGLRRWWTFAGTLANRELEWRLGRLAASTGGADELSIPVRHATTAQAITDQISQASVGMLPVPEAVIRDLKFAECLPVAIAEETVRVRSRDADALAACIAEPISVISSG